jgi:serine/threonine-protein kinase
MSEQTLQLPREGDKIGSGIVLSLISAGGSARVYKTWVEPLELHRAVKVMNPEASQEIRDRFATEARITSKLIHANIVQAFNYGETAANLPYIEMELVNGSTLESFLQKHGALPLPVALAVVLGILEALHYAHTINYTLYDQPQRGVMHRDIKPGNVIFSGGIPKLMDFGIARPVTVSLHTMAGNVPGTLPYMAPETCTGGESDFRSDIYQAGLLLYECISGAAAYPQTELDPLITAIKKGDRKPLDTNSKAAAIVKKCLELDPAKRYQTAQDCLSDVRALFHAQSPQMTAEGQIVAFFEQGTATTKPITRITKAIPVIKKGAKIATIAIPSVLIALTLIIIGFTYGNNFLKTAIKALISTTETSTQTEETADSVVATAPDQPPSPTPQPQITAVAPRPKPQTVATTVAVPAPSSKQAATQETQVPMPPPEDAAFFIEQGNKLLSENKPQEALASFQRALRTPSTSMPRQESVKLSLYGSAKSNTVLFQQGKTSRGNYETAWRAVQNAYAAGTPEHSEAIRRLKDESE